MPRHLFIVSRRDQGLYAYLQTRFAGDRRVQVILDRRHGERRRCTVPAPERRRDERRKRREVDHELTTASHVIVTLD